MKRETQKNPGCFSAGKILYDSFGKLPDLHIAEFSAGEILKIVHKVVYIET
jgi:hypothetical protein